MPDVPGRHSNVIPVAFRHEDRQSDSVPTEWLDDVPEEAPEQPADPVASVYSRADVARIFALDPARLKAWERAGLVRPSAEENGARLYTFQDLVGIRTAKGLVERGIPMARIRRALEALRQTLPGTSPLSELRIVCDGKTLAVRKGKRTFDPITGQLLLDFDLSALRADVVRALPVTHKRRAARTAYDWFLEGCRLDADESSRATAESAYRRAMQLDPSLASAYTNLGTLRLLQGDTREAEALFRRAMAVDPGLAEAPYNLGFMKLQGHHLEEAVAFLTAAVERDPHFADAHFNLAVAFHQLGCRADALPHWLAYLDLEPDGPYASIAQTHVPAR